MGAVIKWARYWPSSVYTPHSWRVVSVGKEHSCQEIETSALIWFEGHASCPKPFPFTSSESPLTTVHHVIVHVNGHTDDAILSKVAATTHTQTAIDIHNW